MSEAERLQAKALRWRDLTEDEREALDRKLEGLYGGGSTENVFDSLAVDKQQALLILMRRLSVLELWSAVRCIENLYGMGGVGMSFDAWPFIKSSLERREDFTTWFARHRATSLGFIEKGTNRASLHLLRDEGTEGSWEAHFDLYNPWASPLNAWRHLLHEKIRRETPDWRVVGIALGYL
ncbi:MAG TPA: hypothetical protein VF779_10800 [Pyrinomonadaceae bacterium]